jgi:glycosyltransferase involved in cell wall biosynthesis
MISVSVIIPCYNIQEYISRSIDSIIKQTLKDFELILVNDGSTDGTLTILNEFSKKESRITIFNKPNGGLSSARNAGLDLAKGEYILFLDGDDWIREDSLYTLYNKAKEDDLEVLIADTLFFFSEADIQWVYKRPDFINDIGPDTGINYFVVLKKKNCYAPMAYNQIYKRSFLENEDLRFCDGVINEDELWTPQVLYKAQRVNCIDFPFYYYFQRDQSIMNSLISERKILDNIFIANSLIDLVGSEEDSDFKAWIWVKAYELYYRLIVTYKAKQEDVKNCMYFNIKCLKNTITSEPQFSICLKYLRDTFGYKKKLFSFLFGRRIKRVFT